MANAFTLFGEISVDTSGMETDLKRAERSLRQTADAFDRLEKNAKQAEGANNKFAGSAQNASRNLDQMGSKLQTLGGGFQSAGLALSAGLTAPLVALGYKSVSTAKDFESLEIGLKAVTKEAGPLSNQLSRLKEVAKLPGLGLREAIQGSTNLQAAGLSANSAERALMAFGNALASVGKGKAELDGVTTALSQIQSKGKVSAEEINQLAERLPQIRVAMQAAFGTANTEALQKMGIDSATFIDKVTTEFEKLPKVAGGSQLAFENFGDAMEAAMRPVGQAILPLVVSAMEKVQPIIEQISSSFANASPAVQTLVVALAALAALAGPVLLFTGTVLSMAGGIASGVAALGGLAAIKASVVAAFAAVSTAIGTAILPITAIIAAVAALYLAYKTNFGGLKDAVDSAMSAVVDTFNSAKSALDDFWTENGGAIMTFVGTMKTAVSDVLALLQPFFAFIVSAGSSTFSGLWQIIKTVIAAVWTNISQFVMMVVNIINGDWRAAGQNLVNIIANALNLIPKILSGLVSIVAAPVKGVITMLRGVLPDFMQGALDLGEAIIDGIVNALKGGWSSVWNAAKTLGWAAINAIKQTLGVESPSREMYAIGVDTVNGFVNALNDNEPRLTDTAKRVFGKLLGELDKPEGPIDKGKVAIDKIKSLLQDYGQWLEQYSPTVETETDKLNKLLADPEVSSRIDEQTKALLRRTAALRDLIAVSVQAPDISVKPPDIPRGEGDGGGLPVPPEPPDLEPPPAFPTPSPWEEQLKRLKERYGDTSRAIADLTGQALEGIGDVFANAVANWDGTAKGFFKSIAQGFAQLAKQIIAELIRIAIMKLVLQIGSAIGGGTQGKPNVPAPTPTTPNIPFLYTGATGGIVRGPGTATSDSIPARLSNGEFVIPASSVKKFGVDFFESLRKGQMPMRGYAGGGMVMPSASSVSTSNSTSNYNNVFNISVPAGAGQQQTSSMIQKQVLNALRKHEKRNK